MSMNERVTTPTLPVGSEGRAQPARGVQGGHGTADNGRFVRAARVPTYPCLRDVVLKFRASGFCISTICVCRPEQHRLPSVFKHRNTNNEDMVMGFFSKDIQNMDDLFVHTLRDIYY